ncbi:MAG: hypothetical protein Q3977_02840 [Oscillospiraceae bacterium]|nr:hypothetical protein [Oscillospiraceae bacterium]
MLQKIKNDRFLQIVLGLALVLLVAAAAVFLTRHAGLAARRASLLAKVETVWTREVEGEENCYLKLTLQDGRMEYRFVSLAYPSLSETLFTYDYTAADEHTLRVTYPDGALLDVTVSLNEDESELTFTPAVTVAEASETWTRETQKQ